MATVPRPESAARLPVPRGRRHRECTGEQSVTGAPLLAGGRASEHSLRGACCCAAGVRAITVVGIAWGADCLAWGADCRMAGSTGDMAWKRKPRRNI